MNETVSICSATWMNYFSLPVFYRIPRCVIIFVGLFSNLFLFVGLIIDPLKCFKNPSSYLIMNLAITDILACLPWFAIEYLQPCISESKISQLVHLPQYISSSSILTMALDRFMSCVYPVKYRILMSGKVTLSIILLQRLLCAGHLVFEMYMSQSWSVYTRSIIALLVLFITSILYTKAIFVLKRNLKYWNSVFAASNTQSKAQKNRYITETRLMTTMFLVSFITVVTLAPKMIYETFIGQRDLGQIEHPFLIWLTTLLYVNFAINPFMYAWRLRNFRQTFKVLLNWHRERGG